MSSPKHAHAKSSVGMAPIKSSMTECQGVNVSAETAMNEPIDNALPPAPRRVLSMDHAPHWRARETDRRVYWITLGAALPALAAGLAFFGVAAAQVVAMSVGTMLVVDVIFTRLAHRSAQAAHGGYVHTALLGLLLALALPPQVDWQVVALAALVTVVVGKGMLGGISQGLWHPALLGRLAVSLLACKRVCPESVPVLDRHHLVLGQLSDAIDARNVPAFATWLQMAAPGTAQAVQLSQPLIAVREMVTGQAEWIHQAIRSVSQGGELGQPGGAVLFDVLWRRLPDFRDLLIGAVPGEIGATSAAALLLGGLVLLYHGYLRWQMVLAFLLAAAITAVVAPLRIGPMVDGLPGWHWLPGLQFHDASPVGPLYVAFHLLSGGLLLAMFFFAADFATRPITLTGQVAFAAGCGLLTILIRLYLFVPGAPFLFVTSGAYLAVLAMNTLTPLIDRVFQPRPFGR